MITVQLNGVDYTNFTDISVSDNIESVTGTFTFTSTADEINLFPIRVGDRVKIRVDGVDVLTGFVETLTVNYSGFSHAIEVTGRNILCDLVDSTVASNKEFEGELSIENIARSLLDGIGLNNVEVVNLAGSIEPFDRWDIESVEVGEKCFSFIEKLARKRQFFWSSDGAGNLILTRASNEVFPYRLICVPGGKENNILSATMEVDHTKRYYSYKAEGNLNVYGSNFTPKNVSEQPGESAIDNKIRKTRFFEFSAEENANSKTATNRAVWESNIRIARSLTYSAIIQGHSVNGSLWRTNRLIDVNDGITNVKDQLFVKSVVFNQSVNDGTTTRLNMTYRNAFTLDAEQKARQAEADTYI